MDLDMQSVKTESCLLDDEEDDLLTEIDMNLPKELKEIPSCEIINNQENITQVEKPPETMLSPIME